MRLAQNHIAHPFRVHIEERAFTHNGFSKDNHPYLNKNKGNKLS